MLKKELKEGTLVQLNPELVGNKAFAGCIMVVTEVKDWGVQGYIQGIGETRDQHGGQAYYRAHWPEIEEVGEAEWVVVG